MSKEHEVMQSQFVSLISHELRTPLSSMMEGTALLLEGLLGDLNEKQRRCLEIIREDVLRLNRVLMDILQLSRIESSTVTWEIAPVSIPDLLFRVRSLFEAEIHKKQIQYSEVLPEKLPQLYTDPEKCHTLLYNLLSNAVKFTPEKGKVEVEIRTLQTQEPEIPRIEILVRDTGLGIERKDLDRIFDPFSQLKKGGDRPTGSLGLGLAITRAFVEMMGGAIRVESDPEKGSLFAIQLPVSLEGKGAPLEEKQGKRPLRKGCILIADDEEHIREIVAMRLELSGYEVLSASNGEEALAQARSRHPDLILLDWLMPVLGGKETLAQLRQDPQLRQIPVVVVSAKSDWITEEHKEALKADGYVSKPFAAEDLLSVIRKLLPEEIRF